MADYTQFSDKFLAALGLDKLAHMIKGFVKKEAELQEDIKVKNPRVKVDGWEHNANIRTSDIKTIDDLLHYLFANGMPEVQPNIPYTLPTMTISVGNTYSEEVGSTVDVTPAFSSFDEGKIGTCVAPWGGAAHQSTVASGSTRVADTTEVAVCDASGTVSGDFVAIGTLTKNYTLVSGTSYSDYFTAHCDYTASTADSYTSYGEDDPEDIRYAHVTGVSSFEAGTTINSSPIRKTLVGYYPGFSNTSTKAQTAYSATITNNKNKYNTKGTTEFYMGPVNTSNGGTNNIFIYIPATRKLSTLSYWDTQLSKWVAVGAQTLTSYYASIPADTDTNKFPKKLITKSGKKYLVNADGTETEISDEELATMTEYKLIQCAAGLSLGSAKWQIIIDNE